MMYLILIGSLYYYSLLYLIDIQILHWALCSALYKGNIYEISLHEYKTLST